jgi:hypothetical protein
MRFTLINQILSMLLMTITLTDAISLTTPEHPKKHASNSYFRKISNLFSHCIRRGTKTGRGFANENRSERQEILDCLMQENATMVNDMIRDNISPARFKTAKSFLLANDSKYFHVILGNDSEKNDLPNEIGMFAYEFFRFRRLMLT